MTIISEFENLIYTLETNMSDIEEDPASIEEYNNFLTSLHRVRMKKLGPERMIANHTAAVNHAAPRVYLEKEIKAACSSVHTHSKKNNTEQYEKGITDLQMCINNATAVQTAINNLYIKAQLQEDVEKHLGDSSAILSPEVKSLLSSSQECLIQQAELREVLDSIAQRRKNILQKRMQVAELYEHVCDLWHQKERRDFTRPLRTDSEELASLRQRLKIKEGRVEIMAHLCQVLFPAIFPRWGMNPRIIEVLEACELVCSGQMSTLDQCKAIVDRLH
ncbi:uncharacterized protein LOC108674143 [Hyalella azteca]|uniref:Uncharacterized protein LOC108674143 n=1 Tax=Hyalella azteca TaxID=294128 RepID=A0A8B7NV02_HYAAZ|nr:uncharacterized protein LOC108674143 [Hyalella azteca]